MKQLINEDNPGQIDDSHDESINVPWYLINSEQMICKFWDLLVTFFITYQLIVVPFVLVYPQVYQSMQTNHDGSFSYGNPDGDE